MTTSLYRFGWKSENHDTELNALRSFFDENTEQIDQKAAFLYKLLLNETDKSTFNSNSILDVEKGRIFFVQYEEKNIITTVRKNTVNFSNYQSWMKMTLKTTRNRREPKNQDIVPRLGMNISTHIILPPQKEIITIPVFGLKISYQFQH